MYRIAVVEDEQQYRDEVCQYIEQYATEHQLKFDVTTYTDGQEIVDDVQKHYDIIFFDIEMTQLNGMDAAKVIRERDVNVVMVFITNMAQYAIEGYEVGALDFVLKPIDYYGFSFRLARALGRVQKKQGNLEFAINTPGGIKKLNSNDIYYIEIENRFLVYHTAEGDFSQRGTLQSAEEMFQNYHFVKCNHWYLVNLKYVTEIEENIVHVAGSRLEISRRNRAHFLKEVTEYIGGGM
ncbi:MAG: LytTR family DNA-binding domain-containing protein [Lachnospiraceae bacterium]|nr:DNA-binding response regulator [Pseudobutyrivibrio sp.]MEE0105751.1 LytTR family DNA-binding domain-containing protein [Lachnospiraceae bacterium]